MPSAFQHPIRRRRTVACGARALLLAAALLSPGCEGAGSDRTMTMAPSKGDFARGHARGVQDAEMSLFDASPGWTWLWMMEPEYRAGYNQGWKDGRGMMALKAKQKESETEAQERSDDMPSDFDF